MVQGYEQDLLGGYGIVFSGTRKIRGAVLCNAGEELYLLKEISVPEERIGMLGRLHAYLGQQGYTQVDTVVLNQEGRYVSKALDGKKYVLRKWYAGRECDVRRPGELLTIAANLAALHKLLRLEMPGLVCAKPLKERYERHDKELRKVRRFVRSMTDKGVFEMMLLQEFNQMYRWAAAAEALLESSFYQSLYKESMERNCIVHGEYNYHQVLMQEEEKGRKAKIAATTNFDKFKRDIQAEDLFYLLRKVMEKHGWKERLGDNMLNAYSAVRPLEEAEIEYLKIRLLYPEKFWKTVNAYYHSNKAWMSAKKIEKLETAVAQTKEKERFIRNLFGEL